MKTEKKSSMNQMSNYILGIYQVMLMVRDTLEYTMQGRKADLRAYNERKAGFKALLVDNAPLPRFVAANGEKSAKVMENLQNFIKNVYSEQSTIVRIASEEVRVDHAQHIQIYEQVIGLYQTLLDIVNGYMAFAKKENQYETIVGAVVESDEYFYRVYSHLVIMDDIVATFGEFNKVMKENQGKPNPMANYIIDDLKKLFGYLVFQKQHNKIREIKYNEMVDNCFVLMETMEGKRALPEGKSFPDLFKTNKELILSLLSPAEFNWKAQFKNWMNEAVEYSRAQKEFAAKKKDPNDLV